MDDDEAKVAELQQQYQALLHAMQTGVMHEMRYDPAPTTSKHLRTGVNSSIVQNSALVMLLVDKGVITWLEYWQYQVDAFRREVEAYEARLSAAMGVKVTLR